MTSAGSSSGCVTSNTANAASGTRARASVIIDSDASNPVICASG